MNEGNFLNEVFFYDILGITQVVISNNYVKLIFNILIATAGGLAKLILAGRETSYKEVLGQLFLAALVGLLVGQFCIEKDLPSWFTSIACATSGLSSEKFLILLQNYILKVLPFGPNPTINSDRKGRDDNNSS